ncbi:fungal specific transcription factor domain-containing protein [Aspergillus ibericus CBS 121593]|uniref:Transcription factor domain-containing protein n=1 Tax=Aspergillus ibericus CBS 121593 TaxID=1448316 RepID=A0A395H365_9EURO|nr:hypothetical protein BO80DRAFT_443646 [Aspergillus ibericus CBS 121593]RAL02337.1 hypothetical protein BO80DRAFT_443646 [Aspergillus ibericus CBS 121593]
MGVKMAEFQDWIFTGLYSPGTLIKAPSERAHLISDLASAMEQWHLEFKQINSDGVNAPQVFNMSRGNWDISYYSTLTLLYHAASSTGPGLQISSPCFNAARNSLLAHLNCFPQYQKSNILSDGEYFHWILLFSSFTPFLVNFLHAISAKDTESVTLLAKVLTTFENFRKASQGSEHLYQICATFTQIAERLDQSRLSIGTYNQEDDSLKLSDQSETTPLFHPDTFQDMFEIDDMTRVTSLYATDILND